MKFSSLHDIDLHRRELEEARRNKRDLTPLMVTSITLGRHTDDFGITLKKGVSGTGSINSLGFPWEMSRLLMAAIMEWVDNRIARHENCLVELGVELNKGPILN